MSSGSAPAMPSVQEQTSANIAQAKEIGALNQGYNRQQLKANRPTQITPWGTSSWSRPTFDEAAWRQGHNAVALDTSALKGNALKAAQQKNANFNARMVKARSAFNTKNADNWTQKTELTPDLQSALSAQQNIGKQLSESAAGKIGAASAALGTPIDTTQAGMDRESAVKAFYDRMLPQFNQNQDSVNANLAAQGLSPTSEAWNRTQDQLGRMRNDLMSTAELQGNQVYNNSLQNMLTLREQPMKELQAMLSGQQVGAPQFSNFSQMGSTSTGNIPSPSDIMQQNYATQMGGANASSAMGGQLAGAGLGMMGSYLGSEAGGAALTGLLAAF